ncbi:MAG TPA: ABC transporter substrate-binding protein [Spirillospora sp.]|nr:ABC transporter substrate-binding protein [Spirillospora sp.]
MNKYLVPLIITILLFGFSAPALAQDANLTAGCVETYDPSVDYFPAKVEVTHAEGFEVEYFNHYKVVRTLTPFPGAVEPFVYVLVQCGTPAPEGYDDAQLIEVPVDRFIALSTTQLPHLRDLGHLGNLVAVDSFLYPSTPEVIEMIENGELVEVGSTATINVEVVLDLEPDVVMANGFNPETDAHPVLMDSGVFTALNSEWMEATLLGRAEWVKFTALFFNEEARANELFDHIVTEYERVSDLAASVPDDERVTVLWNSFSIYSDAWIIPGQQTWVGELLADAGVNWVLMDAVPEGSQPFSFEAVLDAGLDAPIWIPNAYLVNTADDLLGQDARYADFAAFQSGRVYNDTARVNANGGNDFWETGVTNPHLILSDLVYIFYPHLLPDHELIFYQRLG